MDDKHIQAFLALPHPTLCRLIDFERAEVVPGIIPNTFFLAVSGNKPSISMTVELHAVFYLIQPDYWGIEVVGCLSGLAPPLVWPYNVFLDISHLRGKIGIEVIGAHKKVKIKVP
jgi:hypothetical protein